jgi:hypothetical protein
MTMTMTATDQGGLARTPAECIRALVITWPT